MEQIEHARRGRRLLDDDGLKAKGINFSRQHRHRLIKAGKFPRPVKLGANTNAWIEAEIDAYIETRISARDGDAPASAGSTCP
jgi:prophage regulatory protein